MVSSGAIAEGMQRLGWTRRPHAMHELQAAAAVGQMGLAQCYETLRSASTACTARRCCSRTPTSPTASATSTRARRCARCSRSASSRSSTRTTPWSTDEIKFGDNDTLGALVTNLIEADALVILTDQAGLYDGRSAQAIPDAKLVAQADAGDPRLEAHGRRRRQRAREAAACSPRCWPRSARRAAARTPSSPRAASPTCWCASPRGERIGTLLSAADRAARRAQAVARRSPHRQRPADASTRAR